MIVDAGGISHPLPYVAMENHYGARSEGPRNRVQPSVQDARGVFYFGACGASMWKQPQGERRETDMDRKT
jgi:hypothetical protein